MEVLQDELGALHDLATGPEILEKHGLSGLPGTDDLILHAALDDVLDKFLRGDPTLLICTEK
ncbi:hypothetical protein [Agrobacterium sp. 22-226-1]